MKVSGLSILTRKVLVTRQFGAEAWRGLFRDIAQGHAAFQAPITSTTFVPLQDYLAFHDELVRRFFPGGAAALRDVGADSARFALVEGPLKDFITEPTIAGLTQALPKLWHRYFADTPSQSEASLSDHGIEFRIRELPTWHPYFEHVVVGYVKELLEIHCANPVNAERVTHDPGRECWYRFVMDPGQAAAKPKEPRSVERRRERERVLTDREFEVLRLVGIGKTNREIGFLLGISPKTVQHHVMHAYDKVGIYTRAGAALWIAERGLAV